MSETHHSKLTRFGMLLAFSVSMITVTTGCQSLNYWWKNGGFVGPNYCPPVPSIAESYRDADEIKIDSSTIADDSWWRVFNDPDLDLLIETVYQQNLSLKSAACRIAEARAIRNIAAANLLPQNQAITGDYAHTQNSQNIATAFPGFPVSIDDWSVGFDASWEVDLWGQIRRNLRSADAQLDATIKDYDFALVTLIGDVASLYIQIRSLDERLELARQNVTLQEGSLDVAQKRFDQGRTSKLDVVQAESNLATTRSFIPRLELAQRQALNALSVLLGVPPGNIENLTAGSGKLPQIPESVIVGIPAELLLRRPDLRSAERLMQAQFEQIGVAEADKYPRFAINGTLGYQAANLSDLFDSSSFTGTVAPGFRWNVLNFGRLQNNVRAQTALFNQIKFDFENQVLIAQQEVEDGIIEFIKTSEQLVFDLENETANKEAVRLANASYKEGKENFGRVFIVQSNLVLAQDTVVTTRADIALALIRTYKALGGGWQLRCAEPITETEFLVESVPLEIAEEIAPPATESTPTQ